MGPAFRRAVGSERGGEQTSKSPSTICKSALFSLAFPPFPPSDFRSTHTSPSPPQEDINGGDKDSLTMFRRSPTLSSEDSRGSPFIPTWHHATFTASPHRQHMSRIHLPPPRPSPPLSSPAARDHFGEIVDQDWEVTNGLTSESP